MSRKIAVLGLGYVGLPLALAFARRFPGAVGFDINSKKIAELKGGIDVTREVSADDLKSTSLIITDSIEELRRCDFFVVAVPTPVDKNRRPDMTPLERASETLGKVIRKGAIISFESTVYPGVTRDICGPIIERVSGLKQGMDFKLAYSPERVNPGDREHSLEKIIKVVSGEDQATLDLAAEVYGAVITAGIHRAPSIEVAEAAKVIENTQRDLNIALMNELSLIFDRMGIATRDVLEAAGTKWNFLKFSPGLVGGHCIGVDPYYLTFKAEELGYHPEVILSGRRINDTMGMYIAQRLVKLLTLAGKAVKGARVGVLGITFKENVPDIRNSRVPDIVNELRAFGVQPMIADPLADAHEVHEEYGLALTPIAEFSGLDAVVVAVAHREYVTLGAKQISAMVAKGGVVIDVKSIVDRKSLPAGITYWSL